MRDNKLRFGAKIRKAKRRRLTTMRKIAKNSVNFFQTNTFEAQGFIDETVSRWKPRQSGGKSKILVKTGRGRASIREKSVSSNHAVIQTGADYMNYHNTGTKHLPQRKFMGKSAKLDRENYRIIDREFNTIL